MRHQVLLPLFFLLALGQTSPADAADGSLTTLSPNPLNLSVRTGESGTAAMALSNNAPAATGWTVQFTDQNNRADDLEGALAAIMASGTGLNGALPVRFDFTEGETGTSITSGGTGGTPIFSQGNKLSTSSGGPLAYSNGVIASSSTLGSGGRYFTRKLPGLFLFAGDLNGPGWFEVGGYITYGDSRQTSDFTITRKGRKWSAFVSKTVDYWRTINHLILVDQQGLVQSTGTSANDEKHRVSGLIGKRRVYCLLYVTSSTAVQPDSVFEDLAGRLLDVVPAPLNSLLSVSPSSGTAAAGSNTPLVVTANASGVAPGTYNVNLNLKNAAGINLHSVPTSLVVTEPRLAVPAQISRSIVPGMAPFVVESSLSSNLPQEQPWTASIPAAPAWLALVANSGNTLNPLKLRFSAGSLAAGTYRSVVRIVSGSAAYEVPVTLTIQPLAIVKFLADPARPVVYAINQNGKDMGQVLEINPLTRQVVRSVSVGKEPSDLDLTENGSQLVVINTTEPSLSRIDLNSFAVTETIPLAEFSNRNEDIGGHVKCGKGAIVYYVDEQWGPRLRVFNTATRSVLQTFSAESATSPDTSNNYGFGDINLTPDRGMLFGWRQYGDGAGVDGTHVARFTVNANGTLGAFAKSSDYSFSNFTREPFDTPILFSRDSSRMVIKDRVVDRTDMDSHPVVYPDEIYSISPGGEVAVGSSAIYAGEGGEVLHTLAATSTVQAVLPDYSSLVYFNKATKSIAWLDLLATLGSSRLGLEIEPAGGATVVQPEQLKWLPVTGITRYQVYLGTDRGEVETAGSGSALYLGESNDISMALGTALTLGQTYYWRVVPLDSTGQAAGPGTVYSFTVSSLTLSRSSIEAETVAGVANHLETINLDTAAPQAWTASENVPWIRSITTSGTTPGALTAMIDASGLAAGIYQGEITITITSSGASVKVPVSLKVYAANYMIAEADLDLPYVYVISQESNTSNQPSFLLRVDTATNKIESAVPCGRSVTSMSVHYAENRIYLTNWQTGILRVFDRTTLSQVRTYQYSPAGATGSSSGDAYVVTAGRAGRFIVEEQDQWIDFSLIDSANGAKLATGSSREGGGVFEPTGRYYFHGENNISNAVLNKYDTAGDKLTLLNKKRVESYSYYGSRLVASSGDGSRVFWNGGVFDPDLNILMQFNEEVVESTYHGEILFTNTKAINGNNSQTFTTLPLDTKIQAVSGDQKKLYQFKGAAMSVVNLSNIAVLPPRGLIPGIGNASTVIGASQELSWSLEAAALSYDVYFGTSAAAVAAATKTSGEYLGNTSSTRWSGGLPALDPGSTYYWRVDINGFSSTTTGGTWSFGIASVDITPSAVRLAAPSGSPVPVQSLAMTAAAPTAWTASTITPWITLRANSGTTPGSLQFDVSTSGLTTGTKSGSITVQAAGKTFSVPVELTIVTLNVTKLVPHPTRPVVYAINTSLPGEGFCHLLEIDAATAKILRSLPIGFAPTDADLDPVSERLYISNWGYSQTRVIDVSAWAELPSLNLGEDIYQLEVTPNGRLITEGEDQWISLKLWDAATGNSLSTALSVREGDGQADPTGGYYYHCDNNSSGAILRKYDISGDTFAQVVAGPQIGYGSRNLVMSSDGKRLFWLGRTLDENLNILATTPSSAEVYATNRSGELSIGEGAIWWSDSATQLATLPFNGRVAAVSAGDNYLLRFNATTRTLHSTAIATLADLPGPLPRPGQILDQSPDRLSWTPVAGATFYRVYIAANATALQAMTAPSATVTTAFHDLPAPLPFGNSYTWRVDAVTGGTVTAGKTQDFTIRFPQGPELAPSTLTSNAFAAAAADGSLLLGFGTNSTGAQLYDFNSATGESKSVQTFSIPGSYYDHYFGSSVAMDSGKATVGAYGFDTPVSGGGAIYVNRKGALGYWENGGPLTPPSPVANEQFGMGLASSGNLLLAGTSNTSSLKGRVVAYITEPETVQTQVFSASDGVTGDAFGKVIVMAGNRAVISAPGRGSSFNRTGCLYAFTRSTSTGLWSQTQKITIPGGTSSSNAGDTLAMDGGTLVTRVSSSAVAVFTSTAGGPWNYSTTIKSSAATGSSSYFGSSLALHGNQLFIGDTGASYNGKTGGVVFTFRRSGSTWLAGPSITPNASRTSFGQALAAREGWLLVAGSTNSRPGAVFRVESDANRMPGFTAGLPTQVVAGRAFTIPVRAVDADGNAGLGITKQQAPPWLTLTDNGNGEAVLTGTPAGAVGNIHEVQLRASDAAGAQVFWTYRLTILAPTDVPTLTLQPSGADLGVGQVAVLRAAVSGIGPFQWQWYRNGVQIPGANGDSLWIAGVALTDAGSYTVRVSNAVGEVFSSVATLEVHPANRFAGDWPTFGSSPAHTGHHPAALYGTQFISAWSQTVQSGYSLNRAAIANGRAFVVPAGRFATGLAAQALDLQSGSPLWSFPFPSSNSSNPPSVYNNRVYFQRGNGISDPTGPQLFSLNADTGAQVWASVFGAQWESYEAPAVSDLGIFINGGTYGGMYGYQADGSQRFFQSMAQYDDWTPTISNGRLFSWVAGLFQEHNPEDGSIRWTVNTGWNWSGWSMNTVSAVSGDTAAVISTTELVCIDFLSRSIRWRTPASFTGSPAIGSNRVFAIQGSAVRSYSLADGTPGVVYQTDAGTASGSALLSQPIVFNDRLVISNEAKTWVFDLEDGRLLQTLAAGGRLSYSNGTLLLAGNDGILRSFRALHTNANLAGLSLSEGSLVSGFETATTEYIATVPFSTKNVTVAPVTELSDASVTVNGTAVPHGSASSAISLSVGNNTLTTVVTAEDGITTRTYTITLTRLPLEFVFNSGSDVPVTARGFSTGGYNAYPVLKHTPSPGTVLTMVNNTGLGFIHGTFGNMAQGQPVTLSHAGRNYHFVANYFGGTGNDLVLQWAANEALTWGAGRYGQLGNGNTADCLFPSAVIRTGVLSGKSITAVSGGYLHSLALCSDGTIAAWGYGSHGQLGNGGAEQSNVPVEVDRSGVLAGKTVIAISAGPFHNLALCADGSIAAWGYNNHGQLGNGGKVMSLVPVRVAPAGALSGKKVVAVAAAAYHSFALCDDGTVASWGYNDEGELGDGTTSGSLVPVAVDGSGALNGKQVASISAGQYHTLALCTDGTLAAWGYNNRGQLGDGSIITRIVPVEIGSGGALAGKTVTSIVAGNTHSMARCADGTMASWGYNHRGQLGTGGTAQSQLPVAVDLSGFAPGSTVVGIGTGSGHSLLRFRDGTLATWGDNSKGQLGNNGTSQRVRPGPVDVGSLDAGSRFMMMFVSGCAASHNLALAALPEFDAADEQLWLQGIGEIGALSGEDLIGYAFGLAPGESVAGKLPQPERIGGRFGVSFSQPAGVTGIVYGAEWSTTLLPGSWEDVPDTGTGGEHVFTLPEDAGPRAFMRLKVVKP